MPELPEVETLVRGLAPYAGNKLVELKLFDHKVWFESDVKATAFAGLSLREITRHGKYLVYDFGSLFILQHLRMTGKMLAPDSAAIPEKIRKGVGKTKQIRAEFRFKDKSVYFYDTRRFGTLTAVKDLESYWKKKKIAPDPIHDPERALEHFLGGLKKTSRPIKAALLDQSLIAGVGNIYADESLYRLGIHPLTPAKKIKKSAELFAAACEILASAIEARGTTIYNYVNADGATGTYAIQLKAYGQAGEICVTCKKEKMQLIKVGGRSTCFCGRCQRLNT